MLGVGIAIGIGIEQDRDSICRFRIPIFKRQETLSIFWDVNCGDSHALITDDSRSMTLP